MDFSGESDKPIFTVRPSLKERLASLYSYLEERLKIEKSPKLVLTKDEQNAKTPFGLTGYYDHETQSIRLFITNRLDTDILRSFAHEVIHHWQNERGTLNSEKGGSETSEHYAQLNVNLRKREMEAYLFGNILFRDWQDAIRYGPPKTEPFLPQPYD